jgi:hypothetical protein
MPKVSAFPLFTGCWLSPRQYALLERLAATTRRTKSEVLRSCLEAHARTLLREEDGTEKNAHERDLVGV